MRLLRDLQNPKIRLACALVALSFFGVAFGEEAERKQVLVLLPWELNRPVPAELLAGLQDGFLSSLPGQVRVFSDSAGSAMSGELNQEDTIAWIRAKYKDRKFDLVIAGPDTAYRFALRARPALWPGTPILFVLDPAELGAFGDQPNTTGILAKRSYTDTFRLAKRLLPDTRHVALVGGSSSFDHRANAGFLSGALAVDPSWTIIDLAGLPVAKLQSRIAHLPPATIALLGVHDYDADGRSISRREMVRLLEPVTSAPLFDTMDLAFGGGIVGGSLLDYQALGRKTAQVATRLLRGESAGDIPPLTFEPVSVKFDARQLRKWNIPEERLPAGAKLFFREPSLWQRYRNPVLMAGGVFLLQVLLISALLVERRRRRRSQASLARSLNSERLLGGALEAFANLPVERVDGEIRLTLRKVVEFFDASEATLLVQSPAGGDIRYSHRCVESDRPQESSLSETVSFAETMRGTLSIAGVPDRFWRDSSPGALRTMAEILTGAIARRDSEIARTSSEGLNRAVLSSLTGYHVIVDRAGTVLSANRGWLPLFHEACPTPMADVLPGENYLEAWNRANGEWSESRAPWDAVRSVLQGEQSSTSLEHRFPTCSGYRWIDLRVERLDRAKGGAVITHLDITARKRLEAEAAGNLEEIAHENRVAALGELAASLAHEINQPLAAILVNTESIAALLNAAAPDREEVDAALIDILDDARRASGVIRNMRAMLKKEHGHLGMVDLNAVASDTVRLIRNDANLRQVKLLVDLAPELPVVFANAVQLQQVVLNLAKNAVEASAEIPVERRVVVVRTRMADDSRAVVLEVHDSGPGVPASLRATLFQPFKTTKREGLGVGLSISRSIVESFGGKIWMESRPSGGATFAFAIEPSARTRAARAS